MRAKRNLPQLSFPWFSEKSRKRGRPPIRKLRWPPRKGQTLAFRTDFGIEIGVLRHIQQGITWKDYIMKDGRIIEEGALVMSPELHWRDPDSVSESELEACAARVRAAHDANPDMDLRQIPHAWADFCQIMGYVAFRAAIERERKEFALMQIKPINECSSSADPCVPLPSGVKMLAIFREIASCLGGRRGRR